MSRTGKLPLRPYRSHNNIRPAKAVTIQKSALPILMFLPDVRPIHVRKSENDVLSFDLQSKIVRIYRLTINRQPNAKFQCRDLAIAAVPNFEVFVRFSGTSSAENVFHVVTWKLNRTLWAKFCNFVATTSFSQKQRRSWARLMTQPLLLSLMTPNLNLLFVNV